MKTRTAVALGCTLAWSALVSVVLYYHWTEFRGLPLNAKGDFVAGFISPAVFVWLIIGYFQQGEELQQNTEALRLQAEELKNSVNEQRALVEATRNQVSLMEATRIEEKAAEKERSAMRLHYVTHQMHPYQGEKIAFELAFVNTGATGGGVTITSPVWENFDPRRIGQVRPGETFHLRLLHISNLDEEGPIIFDYLDGLNEPAKLVCNITIVSNTVKVSFRQVKNRHTEKPAHVEEVSAGL